MQNFMNSIKLPNAQYNRFTLSHSVKTSFQMGEIVPICVMDAIPGDIFTITPHNMIRFAPMIAPVMHEINGIVDFYFVPNRLLWPEWEDWITGKSDAEFPYWVSTGATDYAGKLMDYLKYPTNIGDQLPMSAMPLAAYALIYDEWFRDENLQPAYFAPLVAGDNSATANSDTATAVDPGGANVSYLDLAQGDPLHRAWMRDYFTACLPFAQKGPDVNIPLTDADTLPVYYDNPEDRPQIMRDHDSDAVLVGATNDALRALAGPTPYTGSLHVGTNTWNPAIPAVLDPNETLHVDVNADATTINTLRAAFALQRWFERNARGGTRYIEQIYANFGVRSSDARLQRPELIGTQSQRITISEVLSTAQTVDQTSADIPIGQMGGHGISIGGNRSVKYFCEEHGWIIGICNIQPVTAYSQGLPKSHSRFDRFDFFWPDFAHLGEKAVKVKELWVEGTLAEGEEDFGYLPQYSEYRTHQSSIHGDFRTTLAFWQLGREFAAKPVLNSSFIAADPRKDIFAVQDDGEDHLWCQFMNEVSVARKVPKFGTPGGL